MPAIESQSAQNSRRSPDQWRTIVGRFENSGLTIKDFCQKENVAPATFSKWRKRFRQEAGLPGFIELAQQAPAPTAATQSWSLQIDLPGGGHLRIQVGS